MPFVKASACGNDFLLVEERFAPVDLAEFTRRACDRHEGVGADGVEWLAADDEADIAARLLNADGSAGRDLRQRHALRRRPARLGARGARIVHACAPAPASASASSSRGSDPEFELAVDMWAPQLGEPEKLQLSVGSVTGRAVSVGNPHFVVLVDRFERGWQAMAAELETHPRFPERTNVELVRVVSDAEVEARFYERGAGETLLVGHRLGGRGRGCRRRRPRALPGARAHAGRRADGGVGRRGDAARHRAAGLRRVVLLLTRRRRERRSCGRRRSPERLRRRRLAADWKFHENQAVDDGFSW